MTTKHLLTATLSLLLTVVPSVAVHADSAGQSSTYSCGPYLQTYVVKPLDASIAGTGIRCVKWSDGATSKSNVPVLAWYGEGTWDGFTYRHVGQAYKLPKSKDPATYQGFASDFYGNGEYYHGNYPGSLRLTVVNDKTIRVTGAWNEEWTKVTDVVYSPLPTPTTCGSFFNAYKAYSADDLAKKRSTKEIPATHQGLRCVLKVGPPSTTWYGVGMWDGKSYAHLVTGSSKGYGSSDFCRASGDYCGDSAYGKIRRRFLRGLNVPTVDGWNEAWIK